MVGNPHLVGIIINTAAITLCLERWRLRWVRQGHDRVAEHKPRLHRLCDYISPSRRVGRGNGERDGNNRVKVRSFQASETPRSLTEAEIVGEGRRIRMGEELYEGFAPRAGGEDLPVEAGTKQFLEESTSARHHHYWGRCKYGSSRQ